MRITLYLFFLFTSITVLAQEAIPVNINPNSIYEYYFLAEKGEIININLIKNSKKKLSYIEISDFNKTTLFNKRKVRKLKHKLPIANSGIHKVTLTNNYKDIWSGNIDIKGLKTDTPILWNEVVDTIGYEKKLIEKQFYDKKVVPIQAEKFYINSWSNAIVKGGKSRILLPVNLPENTIRWYYVFSASRNSEQIEQTLKTFSLASELTEYVNKDGHSLKQATNSLTTPPGANICDIYVLNDEENAKLFKDKEDFNYDLSNSRENIKSGKVAINNQNNSFYYLGIVNPDKIHGIHLAMEIVAITEESYTKEVEEIIPITQIIKVPYVKMEK